MMYYLSLIYGTTFCMTDSLCKVNLKSGDVIAYSDYNNYTSPVTFAMFLFRRAIQGKLPDLGDHVIVRPLSTVGYTRVVASVILSRQWSN